MPVKVPPPSSAAPRERLEALRPVMAKAIKKLEIETWRTQIGQVIQRTFALAGLTQKEAAGLLNRDQAQIARWIAGTERPQVDALFAVESLRFPLVHALAELAGDQIEIETVIRGRRIA